LIISFPTTPLTHVPKAKIEHVREHTFPIIVPLPTTAPTSITLPSPTSAASTTAPLSTTTFLPRTVPSLRIDSTRICALLRAAGGAMLPLLPSSSPIPTPTFARSNTTHPSPSTTGATALLSLLCGCNTVFGPMVTGCVPVICACCAMRTVESRKMDEGLGRRDVRFGAVEERRWSGAGREGAGWADMVSLLWWLSIGYQVGCWW
jgi:hypothetical protein